MVPLTCSFLPTQRSPDKSRRGLLVSASWALCMPGALSEIGSCLPPAGQETQVSRDHSLTPLLCAILGLPLPLPQGLGPTALQVALAPTGHPVPPSSPQDPASPQEDLHHSSLLMKPIPAQHSQSWNSAGLQHLVSGSYFQPGYGISALITVQVEVLKISRSCDFAVP